MPTSSKGFLDIQTTIECGFTLKSVRDIHLETSITKVTGVSFGTPKDYMLQNLKMIPFQSDLGNSDSAINDRINFHFFSFSKLVSPIILYFTKMKPLKCYEKLFLFPLSCSFGSCNTQISKEN